MDPSFTEDEKRFVLAEMIKASRLDIETLAFFVKTNHVEPDWWSMQLPLGRNMNQCVQAAEHMAVYSHSLKRKSTNNQPEHSAKRIATDRPETVHRISPQLNLPLPPPPSHVSILPRPSYNHSATSPSLPAPEMPKKRGRPSRVDKAKRDLRPLLPHPATGNSFQNGTSPSTPRQLLPAPSPASLATRPITPPEAYVATSPGSPRSRKRPRSPEDAKLDAKEDA